MAEAEAAFRLGRDLSPRCTEAEVAHAVESVMVVIELCDSRLEDFKAASAWSKLADNQSTGAWTGLEFVQPGDEVLARFPGIGEARVTFAR